MLVAAADLFDEQTAQQIAERFTRVLQALADDPQAPLHTVDILGDLERELIAGQWCGGWDGGVAAGGEGTLLELFEAQARCMADEVAVVCGQERVSYAELEARANRLARWLIARG